MILPDSQLIAVLKQHFDAVVSTSGRSTDSPLLINGLNVFEQRPLQWVLEDGRRTVMSSVTRQLPLLRAFGLFAGTTGQAAWATRRDKIHRFYIERSAQPHTLPPWGGHIFIDLLTLQATGPLNKGMEHELKDTFPDYDTMHALNPAHTCALLRTLWGAHLDDTQAGVISRHASRASTQDFDFGDLKVKEALEAPPPAFSAKLSFLNSANDLIYAAGKYHRYTQDAAALQRAEALMRQYVRQRHPRTGLGAYMYTVPLKREQTDDDDNTMSWFGDRAARQLGPEFGEQALEMNVILENHAHSLYAENPVMLFNLWREQGECLRPLCEFAVSGLEAFIRYAWKRGTLQCRPMLSDGTDLSGHVLPRAGYYGRKGHRLVPYLMNGKMVAAIVMGALLFESPVLFEASRSLFNLLGLGSLGRHPRDRPVPNYATACSDPHAVVLLCDAYRISGHREYLVAAECVLDRLLRNRWYAPYFRTSASHVYAVFDSLEPYALAYFLCVRRGGAPEYFHSSNASIYGNHLNPDGSVVNRFDQIHFHQAVHAWGRTDAATPRASAGTRG